MVPVTANNAALAATGAAHLCVIVEALGEQWTNGAINASRCQNGVLVKAVSREEQRERGVSQVSKLQASKQATWFTHPSSRRFLVVGMRPVAEARSRWLNKGGPQGCGGGVSVERWACCWYQN